jgi:1,2-dihydroxy-3-keto-5-methylthiopentene dioxygenase
MQAAWVGESVVPATEQELHVEGLVWGSFSPSDPATLADQLGQVRGFSQRSEVQRLGTNPKDEPSIAKEADEHAHVADEVRLIVEGEAVYDIRSVDGMRWLRVWLGAGDALVIPEKRYHRMLVPAKTAIRWLDVFGEKSGLLWLYRVSDEATRAV